ncbi:hypothetical protein ABIF96_005763 [Bradyrhizobium ottawaense]|uniref:hypothetical protein n=1 Tax=Bradyrhizobium ottawaense TaxID=931866 RepID=UPI003832D995
MRKVWTPEEDAKLAELVAAGLSWEEIGPEFGLKRDAARKRWGLLHETPEERADRCEKRRLYQERVKLRNGVLPEDLPVRKLAVPEEVLQERNARLIAPLTITGIICGDPPIGFSALDRKLAEVRA